MAKAQTQTVTPSLSATFGKTQPKNEELEACILGALLMGKDELAEVIDILKPEAFYSPAHQKIYYAILQLFNQNQAIDLYTLNAQLRKNGDLEAVGGVAYLAGLTHNIASTENIETHARLLLEYAMRRSLIALSSRIQKEAYDDTHDTFDLLDRAEQNLFEISEGNIQQNYAGISTLMQGAIKNLERIKQHGDGLTGVPSGFAALDKFLLGWQPSDFIVIAARPGMGKTSFLLSVLRNAAVEHKRPVALFSLEMSSL
jgi:replicative DNA helicase